MRTLRLTTVPRDTANRWVAANRTIFKNASALTAATIVTSGLGFAFWWLAARLFSAESVGVASALISAMTLLAALSVLGLDTHLLGELRRDPRTARSLFTTAALAAGAAGALIGLLLAIVLPYLSSELQPVRDSAGSVALFAAGVSVTAVAIVLDNSFVGLLRGELHLLRNSLHAVAKVVLLAAAGYAMTTDSGTVVVGAWVGGTLISLGFAVVLAKLLRTADGSWRPRWSVLSEIKERAISHHALNIVLQAPIYLLPIIAAIQVSAASAAHFYAAFMTATFLFVLPLSLTTALYALSNPDRRIRAASLRHSFAFSFSIAVPSAALLIVAAPFILQTFGAAYEEGASDALRVLSLAVFPVIVKSHYVTISRIRRRMARAAVLFLALGVVEIAFASFGASRDGVLGLSVAWVSALLLESILVLPVVISALRSGATESGVER